MIDRRKKRMLNRRARHGVMISEMFVGGILLTTLVGTFSVLTVKTLRMRSATIDRQIALDELANTMETLLASDPKTIGQRAAAVAASDTLQAVFPRATIQADIDSTADGTTITVRLQCEPETNAQALNLVAWMDGDIDHQQPTNPSEENR